MLTLQHEIVQAMVVGDKRPYMVGLIVPDPEWSANGARPTSASAISPSCPRSRFHVRASAAVDRVNAELSVIEKVRRFIIADEPFTVENQS